MSDNVMANSLLTNGFIVIALAAFLAWRGYENGVIRTVQRLLSVLAGYAACYFFTSFVATQLGKWFGIQGGLGFLSAALLLFFSASVAVHWSLNALSDWLEEREQEPARIPAAAIGALLGSVLGLLIVWVFDVVTDAVELRKKGPDAYQSHSPDAVRKTAGNMVGGAVGFVIEHKSGDDKLMPAIVARLVSDPVGVSQQLAAVSRSEELKKFFSDKNAQQLMTGNQFDQLQALPTFHDMVSVPESREIFELLGTTVKDSENLSQDARTARLLTDMWQKAERLKNDPRFLQLSQRPDFKQLMANPSPAAMLTNPALKELGEIVFSEHPPLTGFTSTGISDKAQSLGDIQKPEWETIEPTTGSAAESEAAGTGPVIYRWTDEKGHRHFSEEKPEGNYEVEIAR